MVVVEVTERPMAQAQRQADIVAFCEGLLDAARAGHVCQMFVVIDEAPGAPCSVYLNPDHQDDVQRARFVESICSAVSEIIDLGYGIRITVPVPTRAAKFN